MGAEDRANVRPVLRAMVDGLREDQTHIRGSELVLAIEQLAPYTRSTLHVGAQSSHGRRRSRLGAYDLLILDPALKPTVALHQVSQGGVDRSVRTRSRELKLRRRQLKAAVDQPLGRPDVMAHDHAQKTQRGREGAAGARLLYHSVPTTGDMHSTSFPSGSST